MGWVQTLPHICMHLHDKHNQHIYGIFQVPTASGTLTHLIPPIIPTSLPAELQPAGSPGAILSKMTNEVADVKDDLLLAKPTQASVVNTTYRLKIQYQVGDKVMLSTFHRYCEYKQKWEVYVGKFSRWEGP